MAVYQDPLYDFLIIFFALDDHVVVFRKVLFDISPHILFWSQRNILRLTTNISQFFVALFIQSIFFFKPPKRENASISCWTDSGYALLPTPVRTLGDKFSADLR